MSDRLIHVLFLCTHNSARSILAEAILNRLSQERFKAFSAGSAPSGSVNPLAIKLLQKLGHDVRSLRSKSWNEFAGPAAPKMDIVVTVCHNAAGEVCPNWPGQPIKVHWGMADPSTVPGNIEAREKAFLNTYHDISRRLQAIISLPIEKLDRISLQNKLNKLKIE